MSNVFTTIDFGYTCSIKQPLISFGKKLQNPSFITTLIIISAVTIPYFTFINSIAGDASAQIDIAEDNPNSSSNLTISSQTSQTSNPGQHGQGNLSATSTENRTSSPRLPIISELSDKGTYRVELRWSSPLDIQSPAILSKDGFDIELLFLNASSPEATPETIPGDMSNLTTDFERSITSENANLSTMEPIIPVESFDITIYDDSGNVLWSKLDQTLTAGRALLRVDPDTDYSGGITIVINDIKSPKTADSDENAKSDESVRFTASIQGSQN
jgi:hypothetical protein